MSFADGAETPRQVLKGKLLVIRRSGATEGDYEKTLHGGDMFLMSDLGFLDPISRQTILGASEEVVQVQEPAPVVSAPRRRKQ